MAYNVVGVIQSRWHSTRLPGKAFLPFCGISMIRHIVARVVQAMSLDRVVVAVPRRDFDAFFDVLFDSGAILACPDVPEDDLVARYLAVAQGFEADVVVRICADNPCIQPDYINAAVAEYARIPYIFYSNTTVRVDDVSFDGLGAEVFSMSRLKWLDHATLAHPAWREHVHQYFYRHEIPMPADVRLDVNTRADYEFIRDIYEHCYPTNPRFGIEDIVAYLGPERIRACRKQPAPE